MKRFFHTCKYPLNYPKYCQNCVENFLGANISENFTQALMVYKNTNLKAKAAYKAIQRTKIETSNLNKTTKIKLIM